MFQYLIINADDFGLTQGVNAAIIDCFKAGCVTSTTLMVNTPATEDAAKTALANPALGVGLHFSLTLGRPVNNPSKVKSLVDGNGEFVSRQLLAKRLLLGRVKKAEVVLELNAQFQRMQSFGLKPTHIDSHQHVHGFPIIFDAIATLCEVEHLPMRVPWLLEVKGASVGLGRRLRQWLLGRMLQRSRNKWTGRVSWNTGIGSVFDLGKIPDQLDVIHYKTILNSAPEGVFELMVHPAQNAAELENLTSIGQISEKEWQFLQSGLLLQLIDELGVELRNFENAWEK